MFWLILTLLALVAGLAIRRRRADYAADREPWEASLEEDEPLDMDEIRRAEEEWAEDEGWEEPSEEEWR